MSKLTISSPLPDLLFRKCKPPLTQEQALSAAELALKWIGRQPESGTDLDGGPIAHCGDCNQRLTLVRPGKHQCDNEACVRNQPASEPATDAGKERPDALLDVPTDDGRWLRDARDGKPWDVLVRGGWFIGWHGECPIRYSHVDLIPRGGWSRAVPEAELAALRQECERLKEALSQQQHEIEQTLGKALGYPQFASDQKNFPGATEADGVCVGEHVAESLAAEAANKLTVAKGEVARLRSTITEILGWDCLHPEPATHLCGDLGWLKDTLTEALRPITTGDAPGKE